MANPNFTGEYSTNQIYRDQDASRCLTDDLDTMDSEIQGLSTSKAELNHTHSGYAATSHTHSQYAMAEHTHDLSAKADLVNGVVPESQLPSYVDDVLEYANLAAFPATGESGKVYLAQDTNKSYRWGGTTYVELNGGIALGETSATAYRGDRGKTAYDHSQNGTVHVTADQKTAWDSKAAGNHGHSYNDLSDKPTIPAAYTHPANHPASMITGLASVATSGSYNDLENKPAIPTIPASLPANGGNADTVDNKHASDFAAASHTHTAAALIAMASALFGTGAGGGVQYSYTSGDVLKAISAYPQGFHTVYAAAGCSTNPDSSESYRYFIHKTGATIGWILAWGSEGSLYTNYQYGDNQFKGWRCLYDASPAPLWTGGANGGYFMTEGHTITPSKKLSECRNGWILLWSDYDTGANAQANNTDFCTTIIPKRAYTGQVWNGAMWYCDVPTYAAGTATDSETRAIKVLQVYDAKLIGTANNAAAPRNDVVLRAVYEF